MSKRPYLELLEDECINTGQNFRAVLQILVNVLTDDDDEKCVMRETELFTNYVSEFNKSKSNQLSLMSSFIVEDCSPGTDNSNVDANENSISKPLKDKGFQQHVYDDSFFDRTIPRLSLDAFKLHFGMSRTAVQKLMEKLAPYMQTYPHSKKVCLEKRTLLCLWILCNQETFRVIGKRFGMAQGNCHYLFFSVCGSICKMAEELIVWPNPDIQRKVSAEFAEKYKIPNIVGVIGSCHVTIKTPEAGAQTFLNRKGIPCIVLQGVCNNKLAFMDIYAGQAGSVNINTVFKSSPVCEKLSEIVLPDLFLVGDSSFPLSPSLITPYRDKGNLTQQQRSFNNALKPVKSSVQKAFALLKGTFKRLKFLDMQRIDLVVKVVLASCALHNHIIECEGHDLDSEPVLDLNLDKEEPRLDWPVITAPIETTKSGIERRNTIANLIESSL